MRKNNRRKATGKKTTMLTSLLILLCVSVAVTLAYLIATSEPIRNLFNPSSVTSWVDEKFDGETKSEVSIKNTGNTDAYIRAAIIVTWKDEQGNIYPGQPKPGVDYNIDLNIDLNTADWFLGYGGFYYCKTSVAPGNNTPVLINTCTPVAGRTPDGYALNVEILGSAIQSVPTEAVTKAWHVTVTDGILG